MIRGKLCNDFIFMDIIQKKIKYKKIIIQKWV